MCCEKGGRRGRWAYRVQRWHHRGDVVFRTGGLAYDKFAVNNKVYSTTKMSSFIANYNRKLRIGVDIKRKLKVEKAMEFAERMKVRKEVGAVLRKVQEKMK